MTLSRAVSYVRTELVMKMIYEAQAVVALGLGALDAVPRQVAYATPGVGV